MKKYLYDLIIGLVAGLVFFFFVEVFSEEDILFVNKSLYAFSILFFGLYTVLPRFKNRLGEYQNKTQALFLSFLIFNFGFFLPLLTWFILIRVATSNWQLF